MHDSTTNMFARVAVAIAFVHLVQGECLKNIKKVYKPLRVVKLWTDFRYD